MQAATYSGHAVASAAGELKIAGTVKSVGGTTLDATAGASIVTTGDGTTEQSVVTGEIKDMAPMTTVDMVAGVQAVLDNTDAPGTITTAHTQAVAARDLTLGKVVDSADDTARLMIITKYAGSKKVHVYNAGADTEMGTKAGYLTIEDTTTDGDDVNNVRLKSEGMFYAAGPAGGGEGNLAQDGDVGATTKATEVFSYTDVAANDTPKKYVVLTTESTTAGTTTYTYTNVDVTVTGPNDADGDATELRVQAAIPEATDYSHIHFGAWVALGAAKASGDQSPAGLGIGFVQSIGDGLTGTCQRL